MWNSYSKIYLGNSEVSNEDSVGQDGHLDTNDKRIMQLISGFIGVFWICCLLQDETHWQSSRIILILLWLAQAFICDFVYNHLFAMKCVLKHWTIAADSVPLQISNKISALWCDRCKILWVLYYVIVVENRVRMILWQKQGVCTGR